MNKPKLSVDTPVLIELFAAGGGIATSAVMAGIRPVISVEHDPTKPELSKAMLEQHCNNFIEYGGTTLQQTVQTVDWRNIKELHPQIDFLHASPVCSNFSIAKTNGEESQNDIECAIAVAKAIEVLQPLVFTLEQVPAYQHSESWAIIKDKLTEFGYNISLEVVNFRGLKLPQSRVRMVVRASKKSIPAFPRQQQLHCGWYETIKDLIPSMADSSLLPKQEETVNRTDKKRPLFIYRVGNDANRCKFPGQAIGTITRSVFTDQKGNNRNKFANIWLPDGTVKDVSIRAMARLQGFPDWYQFSESAAVAGSAIGYSCPPSVFTEIFKGLLPLVEEVKKIDRLPYDFYESPAWFATELLKHQCIEGTVLEPCVGHGAIARILKLSPHISNIFTNDFDSKKPADSHYDATKEELWERTPTPDWVITNPPYGEHVSQIIRHACKHARKGVAMFCRLSLLEPCKNRSDLPAPTKLIVLPRFCFRKGKDGKWSTDSSTIALFIWEKHVRTQVIKSIPDTDIELFYKTPDQQPDVKLIQEYVSKLLTTLAVNSKIINKNTVNKTNTSKRNTSMSENKLFGNELDSINAQLEALQKEQKILKLITEKLEPVLEIIEDCLDSASEIGHRDRVEKILGKLVWGEDVEVVSKSAAITNQNSTSNNSNVNNVVPIPDGMTVKEFNNLKKDVKLLLGLTSKTKAVSVKDKLLERVADCPDFTNDDLLTEFQAIDLKDNDFWVVADQLVRSLIELEKTASEEVEDTGAEEIVNTSTSLESLTLDTPANGNVKAQLEELDLQSIM